MGRAKAFFFTPSPRALGRGEKVKYHLISITKSISKIFIPNLFSQMKDIKHIRRDFNSVAWVIMPQGSDFGVLWCRRGQLFFSNMVMWHIELTGMTNRTECK